LGAHSKEALKKLGMHNKKTLKNTKNAQEGSIEKH
jgi:hypothetical protein